MAISVATMLITASDVKMRQQLQSEIQQLHRQVENLKEKAEEERRQTLSSEVKILELTEKLKSTENIASMTSDRLNRESSNLVSVSKSKVNVCSNQ
jgi:vacuolar-type H+-ATPase subunit D/Vma8